LETSRFGWTLQIFFANIQAEQKGGGTTPLMKALHLLLLARLAPTCRTALLEAKVCSN
jgi:hypothetical protein